MPLKSTQTNKYETACFVQEAPQCCELPSYKVDPRGYKLFRSAEGHIYVEFDSTLQTFGRQNRMKRQYDPHNLCSVIDNDERITTLKRQNKWRGELNHPNPDIKGQQYSDIRMTIPEQTRTSHMIRGNRLVGDRYKAIITTHPGFETGRGAASEIVDLGAVPSFSVRLYQGKYEIIKRDDWKLGTIDYKYLPTKYWLRLFQSADFYEDFPFVIESNKMHINLGGFTYIYTAFMFERVK